MPHDELEPTAAAVEAGIAAFWRWWPTVATAYADAIDRKSGRDLAQPIGEHVDAIHPGLAWELGPGVKSRHHLAVSSEGDPELRIIAQRWVSRAPPAGPDWEFYPARQRWSATKLTIDDVELDYADFRIGCELDENRERVHVQVFHPAFARMPEDARSRPAFLCLDSSLGEDGVEKWIGRVAVVVEAPAGAVSRDELVRTVDALAARATGEKFVGLEGTTKAGTRVFALINRAIKRVDHLLMDQHVEVAVALDAPPEGAGLKALNALCEGLVESLGHDAVYIGRETEPHERRLHLHVAAAGPAHARIEAWRAMHPARRVEVRTRHDPRWQILRRW